MVDSTRKFLPSLSRCLALHIVAAGSSTAVEPIPDFRAIRWGTPISELTGMRLSKKETDLLIWCSWTEKAGVEDPVLNAKILTILTDEAEEERKNNGTGRAERQVN